MIRESLDYLKKTSDVRRCYVYVEGDTAAMTSPLINLLLAVKVSTNLAVDHCKSIGES